MTTSGWLLCGSYTIEVGHNQCPTLGTGLRAVRVKSVGGKNGCAIMADSDFGLEDGEPVGAPLAREAVRTPAAGAACPALAAGAALLLRAVVDLAALPSGLATYRGRHLEKIDLTSGF